MTFFSTFGRLPRTWLVFAVMVTSGFFEGFGIALFVPVLELIGGEVEESWILSGLRTFLALIGLEVSLVATLALITSLVIGAYTLNYLQARLMIRVKFGFIQDIRRSLFGRLFQAEWGYLCRQAHGDVANQLMLECLRYGQALGHQVRSVAVFIIAIIYAVISAALSWQLMLLTMALGISFGVGIRPLINRTKILGEETTLANHNFTFHVVDYLRGAKLIKVTATDEPIRKRFAFFNENLFRVSYEGEKLGELTYFVLQALPVVTLAVVIVVAHEVLEIAPPYILVFLLIMARIMPRLAQFQQHYQQYLLQRPAVPLVDDILERSGHHQEHLGKNLAPFTSLESGITFDTVSYKYPGGNGPALDQANLHIGRNQMVALVGRSGSGKSTLVDMLAGLRHPDGGAVLIDGTDLREMNLVSWRHSIGYVTQETTVFNDTTRNNLLFACPEATDEDITRCLQTAHLTDVIGALPKGLDTVLGEGGVILSGGEKQRLALARALIRQPALLLLDEATSALDNESERIVQRAIEDIARQMTIFVVAHRLSTVRKADAIYVLEKGHIVETGTYDELLAKKGRFAELHQMQFA